MAQQTSSVSDMTNVATLPALASGFLALLDSKRLAHIVLRLREHQVAAGDVILGSDQASDELWLIGEGLCRIHCQGTENEPGGEGILQQGQAFGEECLVPGRAHRCTVSMHSDGRLFSLPAAWVRDSLAAELMPAVPVNEAREQVSGGGHWLYVGHDMDAVLPDGVTRSRYAQLQLSTGPLNQDGPWLVFAESQLEADLSTALLRLRGIRAFAVQGMPAFASPVAASVPAVAQSTPVAPVTPPQPGPAALGWLILVGILLGALLGYWFASA